LVTLFLLLNLAALPPLPMFLAKFIVIYNFLVSSILSFPYLILIVVVNAVMIASYCQLFMKYITQVYSNSSFYSLY
jgi:formate hydrogenlyase subunit 3/multisubunit Na+/H+ antiporter MnhD subunit